MDPTGPKPDRRAWLEAAGLALVAAALCWNLCSSWKLYSGVPLSDPGGYPALARASHYFYDSGMREPVPVFLTKAALALGAGDDASVRYATALVFCAAVLLTAFLAGRVYGRGAGLAAALVFALNPYAGYYAVQGVSNLTSGLFLLVFWFALAKGGEETGRRAALTGLAGALCMLTRLENILVVLAALCVYAAPDLSERRLKFCARAAALSLLLTLPYLVHQYRAFGNPVYSHAMAARFWLNTEQKGPLSGDRYDGGPLSISSFILRKGPARAAAGLLGAYGKSFFHYLPRLLRYWLLLPALLAGLFFIFKRRDLLTLLLLPALILPITFISTINQVSAGSGIELRFYLNALWLLCVWCGAGLAGAAALSPDLAKAPKIFTRR